MITYTATNTKTGQFYIGSAQNYGRYLARVGEHHTQKPGTRGYGPFQADLQADPHSFKWEWSEDDRDDRNTEESLIACYRESRFLYNVGVGRGEGSRRSRGPRPEGVKKRIAEKNRQNYEQNPERREKVRAKMRETNARRVTCEHCGKVTNPGNYSRYHKDGNCRG